MNYNERLKFFKEMISENRAWWFQEHDYLPQIYAELDNKEFEILKDWFEETQKLNMIGECGIPAMSAMLGFVNGNDIKRIVQLGTYAGYSTLLFGFALRRMDRKRGLVTFDILERVSDFTQKWVDKAGLGEYVRVLISDSTDASAVFMANAYFNEETTGPHKKKTQMLFIDSSHQYEQTLKELHLWEPEMEAEGLIFLHDVSDQAREYDTTGKGGVRRAFFEVMVDEWNGMDISKGVYRDGCGLGIIQK